MRAVLSPDKTLLLDNTRTSREHLSSISFSFLPIPQTYGCFAHFKKWDLKNENCETTERSSDQPSPGRPCAGFCLPFFCMGPLKELVSRTEYPVVDGHCMMFFFPFPKRMLLKTISCLLSLLLPLFPCSVLFVYSSLSKFVSWLIIYISIFNSIILSLI